MDFTEIEPMDVIMGFDVKLCFREEMRMVSEIRLKDTAIELLVLWICSSSMSHSFMTSPSRLVLLAQRDVLILGSAERSVQ